MVGVVLSAAFIRGTCAALIPSGVMTLIQVAFVLIIALLLLSVAAMPVFLTALKQLASKLNGSSNGATSKDVVDKLSHI
ncbi:putative membrane protein YdgH [compost metagenome]